MVHHYTQTKDPAGVDADRSLESALLLQDRRYFNSLGLTLKMIDMSCRAVQARAIWKQMKRYSDILTRTPLNRSTQISRLGPTEKNQYRA